MLPNLNNFASKAAEHSHRYRELDMCWPAWANLHVEHRSVPCLVIMNGVANVHEGIASLEIHR